MEMIRRARWGLVWLCLWPLFLLAGNTLTPEQIVDLRWASSVAIQPQGQFVAYTLRVMRGPDEKPGGAYYELWVVPVKEGKAQPFVQKPSSVRNIQWSPDGRFIYFVMKRESQNKHAQVYRIPLAGGEAMLVSHAPRNVGQFHLSPDGRYLAYLVRDAEPDSIKQLKKKGFDQKIEDEWTGVTRLYVEALEGGQPVALTPDTLNVWEFDWAPDGNSLLFRASHRPFVDDNYMFSRNYRVSREGGPCRLIYPTEGKLTLARVSPNGGAVAWLGATRLNDPYPGTLYLLPEGAKEPINLTPEVSFTGTRFLWKDEHTILLEAIENTYTVLYEVKVPSGKRKKLLGGKRPVFHRLSLAGDGKTFAVLANTNRHPDEVYVGRLGKTALQRRTVSNPDLEKMPLGGQEVISWKGPDDWTIYGILIKPVGYQPGRRYPLVMQVHGGPEGARLDGWNTYYSRPLQLLAQQGFMVLIPNYRGSIGRGVAFAMGDHRDMMGKEFEDMLAGIDTLIARGLVDPHRVGVGGGSYGGYTTAWAATRYSQRFAAGVMFAGISNQISKIGLTDTPQENQLVHWDLNAYQNLDFFWERSPLKYWSNAQTPLLIAHGMKDERVPTGQAHELYRALKYKGVPVKLVLYPREPHGLRERAHQLDFCRRAVAWYRKYLQPGAEATN